MKTRTRKTINDRHRRILCVCATQLWVCVCVFASENVRLCVARTSLVEIIELLYTGSSIVRSSVRSLYTYHFPSLICFCCVYFIGYVCVLRPVPLNNRTCAFVRYVSVCVCVCARLCDCTTPMFAVFAATTSSTTNCECVCVCVHCVVR